MLERLSLEVAARDTALPVLLAYGSRDLLVPIEQGLHLRKMLANAELLTAEGHTHLSAPMAPGVVHRLLDWIEENG
jgi:pimeloyl-ACP methyl ester carboxylesterase